MHRLSVEQFRRELSELEPIDSEAVVCLVDRLLAGARQAEASDLHLQPTADGLEVRWRVDGMLQPVQVFPRSIGPNMVARLKVLAELLTYRTDVPQEGRIRDGLSGVQMRVCTFPTLHGEKAVVRLFGVSRQYERLADLALPEDIHDSLRRLIGETSGALLVTGPAGTGKTTTVYASLRELTAATGASPNIVTLEDPIEVEVPGVSQSQVSTPAGFDMATGLRFVMRQDPEVIMVGEIRDRETAEVAFQAALTGHLVFSTFHAGSSAGAISRLSDMGIEPYVLRSGVIAILSQRLVRRLCSCAKASDEPETKCGLPVANDYVAVGCKDCGGTGYRGRLVLAELLVPGGGDFGRAVLSRSSKGELEQLAVDSGMVTLWKRGCNAVESGATSASELRRIFGFTHRTEAT